MSKKHNTNYAIKSDSFEPVSWRDATKDGLYKCPECHAQIWFKQGPLRKYFTHRPHDPLVNKCKYYDNVVNEPYKQGPVVNPQTEIAPDTKYHCDYCVDNGNDIPNLAINTLTHFNIKMDCSMNICNECHLKPPIKYCKRDGCKSALEKYVYDPRYPQDSFLTEYCHYMCCYGGPNVDIHDLYNDYVNHELLDPLRLCIECKMVGIDSDLPDWKKTCNDCFKKLKAPKGDDVELPCISCKEYFMRRKNETWRVNCLTCYKKKMNYK